MGKKNSRRLKLLLLVCAFIGLKVLSMAASYTSATIFSPASVRITDSANALIAVHLPDKVVCFTSNPISGKIVNNMGVPLHSLTVTNALLTSSGLGVGGSANFAFNAPSNSGLYEGEIKAQWANGSAVIPYSIGITIVDLNNLHVSWDETLEMVIASNNSGYTLDVRVGDQSVELPSGQSSQFERTGDETVVVFSIGGYSTQMICKTLPPRSQVVVADESLENNHTLVNSEAESLPIPPDSLAVPINDAAELEEDLPAESESLPAEVLRSGEAEATTNIEANGDAAESLHQINP